MKQKSGTIRIDVDEQDFGTICACALRYAMGRKTYMPELVRGFVRQFLPQLPDSTLAVMIRDCEFQAGMNLWGDESIDKPGWVKWKQEILAEMERRGRKWVVEA